MPPALIGCYIYPLRFFGFPDPNDREAAAEIIKEIQVDEHLVHVTRGGGLFVVRPARLTSFQELSAFDEGVARSLNRLICEFTLAVSLVSDPVTPVHFGLFDLRGRKASFTSAGGSGVSYYERSIGATLILHTSNWWVQWQSVNPSMLDQVAPLSITEKLSILPNSSFAFIAGAYSFYSRGQMAEAIVDAFVVIEQIIDRYWKQHIADLSPSPERRDRLRNTTIYGASTRTEILETIGVFDPDLSKHFHQARRHRNNVVHEASIGSESAVETMNALKVGLELLCDVTVATPHHSIRVLH